MKGLNYLFGILCFVLHTESRPNGSPRDSCFYMTPRHVHPHTYRKVFPTKALGLYNITTSADVFRPDRPIRVTLWGPPFKGFLLVAAEEGAKDWPTGIFYSEDGAAKRLTCLSRGDTTTHHNNSYKDSVSVLWYGPENMMSEQIQFIATVVVNLTIYYTNIRSGMIRLDPSLHAAAGGSAGGEGAPVAVTMDPWLSGQSVTRAPTNWWNNLAGGGVAGAGSAGSIWGTGTNTGWGSNTGGNSGWGANTDGVGGLGSNTQTGSSGWGTNNAAGSGSKTGGTGGWGPNTQTGNSGRGTNNAAQSRGSSGWGSGPSPTGQSSGSSGWGTGPKPSGQSSGSSGWGSSSNTGSGSRTNQGWGSPQGSSGTGSAANTNNVDWQQRGQGSLTSSSGSKPGPQWNNADGSSQWNTGQTSWNAPGDGRPIWNWNSGKISSTAAPASTQAPVPGSGSSGTSGSAWSASALLQLIQSLGYGQTAAP